MQFQERETTNDTYADTHNPIFGLIIETHALILSLSSARAPTPQLPCQLVTTYPLVTATKPAHLTSASFQ